MSALSALKIAKKLLTVAAILVGVLILLTSVQPTDAGQEEGPTWDMDVRHGCIYEDRYGNWDVDMTCVRARCHGTGNDCTWQWRGGCFKIDGGYCFD